MGMQLGAPQISRCFLALSLWLFSSTAKVANAQLSHTYACSESNIEAVVDPKKSRKENLKILSQEFFHSVNTVDHCDPKIAKESVDGLSIDSSVLQTVEGSSNSNDTVSASKSLVGTTQPVTADQKELVAAKANAKSQVLPTVSSGLDGSELKPNQIDTQLTNGKTPDDIPNVDNDSVFEGQIRAAAIAEPDPEIQNKLWNEYRTYKGLPERD